MIHTVLNPSAAPSREPSDGFAAGRAADRRPGGFASLLSGAVTSAGPRSRQAAAIASSAAPLVSGADEGPADRTADEVGTWAAARSAGIDGASPLGATAALLGGGLGSPSPGSAVALPCAGVESAGTPPTGAPSRGWVSAPPAQPASSGAGEPPIGRAAVGIVPPPSGGEGQGPGGSGAAGSAADSGSVIAERVAPAPAPGGPSADPALPTTPGGRVDHGLPGVGKGIHRQPSDDPGLPSPGTPPFMAPAPTPTTPPAAGRPGPGAVPEAPLVDGELGPEAGTGGVNGPGAAADPHSEGAIDAAGAIPGPALSRELTAADRVPLQGASDVSGPAPAGGRLAERVAEAVERLELAPPPRSIVLDLGDVGGMKLSISLRGQAVHVTVLTPAGAGQPPSADWSRDLASALAGRGFEFAGSGEGETGERAGRERPQDRPNPPAATPTATNPRPRRGRREAADGWRL